MARAGFAYYVIDGEMRALMTIDQLTAFLAEHGIERFGGYSRCRDE
jgi:hypothetical protein